MLRVHILSEPIWSPQKEGLCKIRYEKDGLLGWMCPVFDCPLYENGMAEQIIQQFKRMQQQVKWVVSNGCDSLDDGESSDGGDCIGEEESETDEIGDCVDALVTAPTRALQRRQHNDHDYIPPCLQTIFDTCRGSTDLDLACHLNEILHNCIVPIRHLVKVPTRRTLGVGKSLFSCSFTLFSAIFTTRIGARWTRVLADRHSVVRFVFPLIRHLDFELVSVLE